VVANLKGCSMDESGSTAVLLSLEAQAQSLSTLILSGNRLGDRGTRGLNKILASDAVSLQVIASPPRTRARTHAHTYPASIFYFPRFIGKVLLI
jgi:hypothetical protein